MTTEQLYKELCYVNHSRENRLKYAYMVIDSPSLIPKILDIIFMVDNKQSPRAAWLLEFVARENLKTILPYLDRLLENMNKVYLDSAVRPMAKICECLVETYYNKNENSIKQNLTDEHKKQIIECCFDWLISNQKIAPKAYSMNTLYLLGLEYDWIHPELANILERDYYNASAGFKARANHILKKINNSY